MNQQILAIDQYGTKLLLDGEHPRKELLEILQASHAEKMYIDTASGETKHIGYVVAGMWYRFYVLGDWTGRL